jgi:inner membrane transporter RhtA
MRPATQAAAAHGKLERLPPQSFFLVSAVFHYLGPSLAVLLFARMDALGVAWLRIASAAVVFALWRRPWRLVPSLDRAQLRMLLALGAVLAMMNSCFYLAVARLPLSTAGAIEFLGTVILAALGARTRRNAGALVLTCAGVAAITAIRLSGQPLGFVFAFANCALFMLYVMLGHRIASAGSSSQRGGIDLLAASMLVAMVFATPIGLGGALRAFGHPVLLLAGAGVGVCSSVIPYVTDQLAMARLSRATFSLMLALLPVFATIIGAIVLRQIPTPQDIAGIVMVAAGVALHKEAQHNEGKADSGLRKARHHRPEGFPALPGDDELRQQGRARLAPRRIRGRAVGQGRGRRRRDLLRRRGHVLRWCHRGDHRALARQALPQPGRLRAGDQGVLPYE